MLGRRAHMIGGTDTITLKQDTVLGIFDLVYFWKTFGEELLMKHFTQK